MMKFIDLQTGRAFATDNAFVIEQCKKYPKRYKGVKEKPADKDKEDNK